MEIKTIHDLVQLGIEIFKKTEAPKKELIITARVEPKVREAIFSDVLEYGIGYDSVNFDSKSDKKNFYSFTILGMKFHLF